MSNQKGFSLVLITLGGIFLIPVILLSFHQASLSAKKKQIENAIQGLRISASPVSKQCGGDGVDSNAWCDYKYNGSTTLIDNALAAAGYKTEKNPSYTGNLSSEKLYLGGEPKMSFRVSNYNGVTSLYGELAN